MSFRNIRNVTILADVGEEVILPSTLIALTNDDEMVTVNVTWEPSTVDTSKEKESIHIGKVDGYVHDVLCSVHVSTLNYNPESVFPHGDDSGEECTEIVGGHCIDQFGVPKQDIQTADIPDIDDYQYFKAKAPRTMVEEMQLKQLRELLADKIILARDINHMRNAIIAIQKFIAGLSNRIDDIESNITDIEERIEGLDELLENMVIGAENIGDGAGLFSHITGEYAEKILNFRTLEGRGADVREEGNKVIVEVEDQAGCGVHVKGDRFTTCGAFDPTFGKTEMGDGYLKFSDYFGMKMVRVKSYKAGQVTGSFPSMLWVMGMGTDADHGMMSAGRMLKASRSFIMEYKTDTQESGGKKGYSGIVIDDSGAKFYNHEPNSRINAEMVAGQDAYTKEGAYIPDGAYVPS